MTSKFFLIPSVGQVEVAKHHRAKRITLKLKPGQNPKVVIPKLMTYKMGLSFAVEKQNWIIEHQQKLLEIAPKLTLFKEGSLFTTRYSTINIRQFGNKLKASKKENTLTLTFPEDSIIEDKQNQSAIREFIIETLRKEAKQHLIPRTESLANKYGFKINKVFIKNLKSRWGSCSSINNINLNLHLMRLPEHLSDFIILHELCHTVQKNHGPKFHELLNTISGNEKLFNRELKSHNIDF